MITQSHVAAQDSFNTMIESNHRLSAMWMTGMFNDILMVLKKTSRKCFHIPLDAVISSQLSRKQADALIANPIEGFDIAARHASVLALCTCLETTPDPQPGRGGQAVHPGERRKGLPPGPRPSCACDRDAPLPATGSTDRARQSWWFRTSSRRCGECRR